MFVVLLLGAVLWLGLTALLVAQSTPPQPPGDVLPGADGFAAFGADAAPIPPEAMFDPDLDTAFALAAIDFSTQPGVTYFVEEAGRTVDVNAGAGVIYVRTRDQLSGELLPGRVLIAVVIRVEGVWTVRFPGDPNYTASFDFFPPALLAQIDTTPYEPAAAAGDFSAQALNDYALPWAHNQWATVSRSYNFHGTGQIDFVLDGSDIAAAKNGTIIYVNDTNTINTWASGAWWYWNVVVIQHSASEYSTYAHLLPNSVPAWIKNQCSRSYARANCAVPVRAGEIIGKQGNTGYSSGPHLHMSFGRTFYVDTRFAVPTAYSWNLQSVSFSGYTLSQVTNWPVAQRLRAVHVDQPRNPSVPPNQNLLRNGDFGGGANITPWTTTSGAAYTVANGILNVRRAGEPAVVVTQEMPYEAPANLPFEVALQLGNAGGDAKQVTLTLDGGPDGSGSLTCAAALNPNAPLQTFVLRGRNSAAWSTLRLRLTVDSVGGGNLLVDNVGVRQRSDITPTATTCFFLPTLTAPSGTITTAFGNPTYTWTRIPGAARYDLAVYRSEDTSTPLVYLTDLADDRYCSGQTCSVEATTQPYPNEAFRLTNATYTAAVRSNVSIDWGPNATFTLNAPTADPPTLAVPTDINTLRPVFRWSLDGSATTVTGFQVAVIQKALYDAGTYAHTLDITYTRSERCGSPTATACSLTMPTDLIDDTNYYMFVRGIGPGGFTTGGMYGNGWSGVEFRIDTIADSRVPSNVVATGENGHPIIRWDDDTEANSYEIAILNTVNGREAYRDWQQKGDAVTCDGTTCEFRPTLSLSNGTYAVYIYACGAGGCSSGGPYNNGRGGGGTDGTFTLDLAPPPLVADLTATPIDGNLRVTWTGADGAAWYQVWAGTDTAAQTFYLERHSSVELGCRVPGETCAILLPLGLSGDIIRAGVQAMGPGGALATGGQYDNGAQVTEPITMP